MAPFPCIPAAAFWTRCFVLTVRRWEPLTIETPSRCGFHSSMINSGSFIILIFLFLSLLQLPVCQDVVEYAIAGFGIDFVCHG